MSIVVLGAGVVGLSTGCYLQALGFKVVIVAENSPKKEGYKYCSPKGAANWRSFAAQDDQRQQFMDGYTFKSLWKLSRPDRICDDNLDDNLEAEDGSIGALTGVHRSKCFDFWREPCKDDAEFRDRLLWFHHLCPQFREMTMEELRQRNQGFGFSYWTLHFEVDYYLENLLNLFLEKGGKLIHAKVNHVDDLYKYGQIAVNCSGFGSRTLLGVEDKKIFPTRGQTLLVKMPWLKEQSMSINDWSYVILRGTPDGVVCLGGTAQAGSNDYVPSEKDAQDIIQRIRENHRLPRFEEALTPGAWMVNRVGLRPTRMGGIRVAPEMRNGKLLIHNYGHGGYGYLSSIGSARIVGEVLSSSAPSLFEKVGKVEDYLEESMDNFIESFREMVSKNKTRLQSLRKQLELELSKDNAKL